MEKKSLRPFGEWDIRLKLKKEQEVNPTKIILTSKEKSELIFEAIFTMLLLLLINCSVLIILGQIIQRSPALENMIFGIKVVFWDTFQKQAVYSWQSIFIIICLLVDIGITYWRIKRRYKQYQLQHILSELHYIANGHYDHLVHFELNGDLGSIVDSINGLVRSTKEAIEEERRMKDSKEELITNISHDIRTPLTSIIGYLQLIENQDHLSEEDLKKYVHIAYSKAEQMKVMVDDLFEYATMQQNPNSQLHLTVFDLSQLMNQIAVDFQLQTENDKLQLTTISEPEAICIEADPDKIVRIFSNLLSNAFKYGEGATKIEMLAQKEQDQVRIVVRNNGRKIPKHALSRLFDRFYRVDSSRTSQIKGTGLGLAIVESIVQLHHGTIEVTSNDDWTSFIITLPLQQKETSERGF